MIEHIHHIIPRHAGGSDDADNKIKLTLEDHIIAHEVRWRMLGQVNDLRAMKMLGVNLTPEQRSIVGKWCHENNIGMFKDPEITAAGRRKGLETQIREGIGIHDPERKSEFASLGGVAGGRSQKEKGIGIHNPDNYAKNARAGGLAASKLKFKCGDCDKVTNAGPLGVHQKATGHKGKIKV